MLEHLEQLLDEADRALTAEGVPAASFGALPPAKGADNRTDTFAAAADHGTASAARGD